MSKVPVTRIFLSYSWDSEAHKDRVLALAQRLRDGGLDAWIDRFTPFPAQGWPRWMQDEIGGARFVLCVVTKAYADRFLGHAAPGKGLGANWEGSIVTWDIFQNAGRNEKFIPVIFESDDAAHLPHPLCNYTRYHAVSDYDSLYRLLTGQPEIVPRPIGGIVAPLPSSALTPLPQPKIHSHRRDRGNLPRLPYFFGRERELDTIAAALHPDSRTWLVLIDGPGGIGKTALAIRASEVAPEAYYPRVVFVSSKVSELESDGVHSIRDFVASGYLEILNAVARELGISALSKLDEKERPAALHSLLREKPALLVLDNLESLAEDDRIRILEFLKRLPTGSKGIVTSRRRTDVQAEVIRLESMERKDAMHLIAELGRNNRLLAATSDADRNALYDSTGGNPLILRWVAGQLGRGHCRTITDALNLLKQSPAGEKALEFILGDLAETFTRDEMSLLAALRHLTDPVSVDHLAGLSGVAPLAAQPTLESLADRAFVIADAELRYFALTPLVADFLRGIGANVVRAADASAAGRRLLETEVRGDAERLQEMAAELQQLKVEEQISRTRGDNYASIIHDINGPLTVISGYAQLMNGRLGDANQLKHEDVEFLRGGLITITRQVSNCVEISRRSLSFLRHQSDDAPRVSINQLLADLSSLVRVHPGCHDHQLTVHPLAEDMGVCINGTDFIQIMLNLTVNAFQHPSPSQLVTIECCLLSQPIDVAACGDGPEQRMLNLENFDNIAPLLKISVIDTGPGIPPEILPKIFLPFFSTKSRTGLGLSIVQRLIKEGRGALRVQTRLGEGTTFTVYLRAIPVLQPSP